MKRRSLTLLTLCVVMLLMLPVGAGFGYVEGATSATVLPGDKAEFRAYVFGNMGDVKVTHADVPDEWSVNVGPNRVNLPVNKDYRYVQMADGYQKAAPVTLTADIPLHAEPGTYPIMMVLESNVEHEAVNGTGVTLRQRQTIDFTVDVLTPAATSDRMDRGQDSGAVDEPNRRTEGHEELRTEGPGGAAIVGGSEEDETEEAGEQKMTGRISADRLTDPVVLFILFQIMWGIALVYVLKRREIL